MRWLSVCAICVGVCLLSSCQQPNRQLMTSLNDAWTTIEPWAVRGVETDDTLQPDQVEARRALIADFGLTLKEGLEHAE